MTKILAIDLGNGVEAEFDGKEITLVDSIYDGEIVMTLEQMHQLCEFIRENREHGTCP